MAKRPLMQTPPIVKGKPPRGIRPQGPKAKISTAKPSKMAY